MPSFVVPFRGRKGKSRLDPLPPAARESLASAMLQDVVLACSTLGSTFVVAPSDGETLDLPAAVVVADPGGGQGAAVRAALATAALDSGGIGPFLVVNADVPCVTPRDLLTLAGAVPEGGLALVAAEDGTTNAVAVSSPELFAPVYGPGSASRFAALGVSRTVAVPNLVDDVDTLGDLDRLHDRLGPHTRAVLDAVRAGAGS